MKYIHALTLVCVLLCSCKKETHVLPEDIPENDPEEVLDDIQNGFELSFSEIVNDSSLKLGWQSLKDLDVQSYRLTRQTKQVRNGRFEHVYDKIFESTDKQLSGYHDKLVPFSPMATYQLLVTNKSGEIRYSKNLTHNRTTGIFSGYLSQIIADTAQDRVYVFGKETGQIMLIDYKLQTLIRSAQVSSNFGFCELGVFNNQSELYIPTADGWVDILDASTLVTKSRIYVAGLRVASVAYHDKKLFVSTTDQSNGVSYENTLKVFDRATEKLITYAGFCPATRVLALPGNYTRLLEITTNLIPTKINSFLFDNNGTLLQSKQDPYHGNFHSDAEIFKAFPDGRHVITSSKGTIIDTSLAFDRALSDMYNPKSYWDFEFSADSKTIYAANDQTEIEVISYPGLTTIRNIYPSLTPVKLFRDENSLYCISADYSSYPSFGQTTHFIFENFSL